MELNNKKILVIGGSGFLGNAVVAKLIKLSYMVTIFDKTPPRYENIHFIHGDILNQNQLNRERLNKISI